MGGLLKSCKWLGESAEAQKLRAREPGSDFKEGGDKRRSCDRYED